MIVSGTSRASASMSGIQHIRMDITVIEKHVREKLNKLSMPFIPVEIL
jgi:hypothetical protein